MLKLKPDKVNDYITDWKSKGVYNSKFVKLPEGFLPYIKYFGYKIGIQFNNTPLVIEENNYKTKILNVYIVYGLYNWPKILLRNFTIKKFLFGATAMVKNIDKEKFVPSGYAIAFDGKGSWNFGNVWNSI